MPKYKSPEMPPVQALRDATAALKAGNDARAAKLAASPAVVLASGRLNEEQEYARCELIALCDMAQREDEKGDDPALRLQFYAGLREAIREFCTALGARTAERRNDSLQAMRDAIDSLKRYQGER